MHTQNTRKYQPKYQFAEEEINAIRIARMDLYEILETEKAMQILSNKINKYIQEDNYLDAEGNLIPEVQFLIGKNGNIVNALTKVVDSSNKIRKAKLEAYKHLEACRQNTSEEEFFYMQECKYVDTIRDYLQRYDRDEEVKKYGIARAGDGIFIISDKIPESDREELIMAYKEYEREEAEIAVVVRAFRRRKHKLGLRNSIYAKWDNDNLDNLDNHENMERNSQELAAGINIKDKYDDQSINENKSQSEDRSEEGQREDKGEGQSQDQGEDQNQDNSKKEKPYGISPVYCYQELYLKFLAEAGREDLVEEYHQQNKIDPKYAAIIDPEYQQMLEDEERDKRKYEDGEEDGEENKGKVDVAPFYNIYDKDGKYKNLTELEQKKLSNWDQVEWNQHNINISQIVEDVVGNVEDKYQDKDICYLQDIKDIKYYDQNRPQPISRTLGSYDYYQRSKKDNTPITKREVLGFIYDEDDSLAEINRPLEVSCSNNEPDYRCDNHKDSNNGKDDGDGKGGSDSNDSKDSSNNREDNSDEGGDEDGDSSGSDGVDSNGNDNNGSDNNSKSDYLRPKIRPKPSNLPKYFPVLGIFQYSK